jgi:hypothetical protein
MKTSFLTATTVLLSALFISGSPVVDSATVRWKKAMADNDEYIHSILAADRNVLENAKVLIHDLETKKAVYNEMALYNTDEMGRSLDASEQYLTKLEKATDIAMDVIYVKYLKGLHQHYLYSLEQVKAIQAELKKSPPEKSVITMKATVIYAEMKKAEEEQIKMHEKMGISEPGEPVQPGK